MPLSGFPSGNWQLGISWLRLSAGGAVGDEDCDVVQSGWVEAVSWGGWLIVQRCIEEDNMLHLQYGGIWDLLAFMNLSGVWKSQITLYQP